jgi:hypothetical protein
MTSASDIGRLIMKNKGEEKLSRNIHQVFTWKGHREIGWQGAVDDNCLSNYASECAAEIRKRMSLSFAEMRWKFIFCLKLTRIWPNFRL